MSTSGSSKNPSSVELREVVKRIGEEMQVKFEKEQKAVEVLLNALVARSVAGNEILAVEMNLESLEKQFKNNGISIELLRIAIPVVLRTDVLEEISTNLETSRQFKFKEQTIVRTLEELSNNKFGKIVVNAERQVKEQVLDKTKVSLIYGGEVLIADAKRGKPAIKAILNCFRSILTEDLEIRIERAGLDETGRIGGKGHRYRDCAKRIGKFRVEFDLDKLKGKLLEQETGSMMKTQKINLLHKTAKVLPWVKMAAGVIQIYQYTEVNGKPRLEITQEAIEKLMKIK